MWQMWKCTSKHEQCQNKIQKPNRGRGPTNGYPMLIKPVALISLILYPQMFRRPPLQKAPHFRLRLWLGTSWEALGSHWCVAWFIPCASHWDCDYCPSCRWGAVGCTCPVFKAGIVYLGDVQCDTWIIRVDAGCCMNGLHFIAIVKAVWQIWGVKECEKWHTLSNISI